MQVGFPELTQQFNRIFSVLSDKINNLQKYIFIFDDFNEIKDPRVTGFFERILASQIPGLKFIIISRNEPALNLISLMSKGCLSRIDGEDLLFNWQETADYFTLRGMPLLDDEVTAIYNDTEGWALGVNLVLEELKKSDKKYTNLVFKQDLLKLLEDRIFASTPLEFQNYLVKLSIFDRWPLELLERCAGELPEEYRPLARQTAEMDKLSSLARYDRYLHGYYVHHVFIDYLRKKQKNIPTDQMRRMYGIASAWCLESGLKMDAAFFCEQAGDFAGIAGVLDTFSLLIPKAAATPLLEMIGRLNTGKAGRDESLLFLQNVCRGRLYLSLSQIPEAREAFNKSIAHFEALPPSLFNAKILAESWKYLGFLEIMIRRFTKCDVYISCFEKSDHYENLYPRRARLKLISPINTYASQISHPASAGDFEGEINALARARPEMANLLGGILYGLEDLLRTEFAYYRGNIDEAEQFAWQTVFKAREKGQCEIENRGLHYLCRIIIHRGGAQELAEVLRQIESLLSVPGYENANAVYDVTTGWLFSQLGETNKVPLWLRSRKEASEMYSVFRNFEAMVKAKYMFKDGQYAEILSFLNLEEIKNGLGTYLLGALEIECLKAAARHRLGDKKGALASLECAWQIAAPSSLIMPFIELGEDMRGMASAALAADCGIPRPWLEEVRDRAAAYGKSLYQIGEQYRNMEEEGPGDKMYLSQAEREILAALAQGLTREKIARQSGQSLGMVKTTISQIYRKLGAVNRADAIRIAISFGIL
jgi:LuxR family maltose regulon positive regulatory protein